MSNRVARPAESQDISPAHPAVSGGRASKWLGLGLDLVFPPICAFCQNPIETSACGLLCDTCRAELVDGRQACPRCGVSGLVADAAGKCLRCKDERFSFDRVVRLGGYAGSLRSAVLRIKTAPERALATAMGDLLAVSRSAECAALEPDAVVPIPMHWSRRMWRGVNSPETIAERLGRRLGVPSASHLLVRRRRTAPQASLSPTKRVANVRGAFRVRKHPDLSGARLLLVDDIMTTGATVNEAAKMLCRGGASFVGVVVLARAEGLG
jgi:ComF family protein